MQKKSRAFLILGILLLSFIPFAVTADSAPPPVEVWFVFHSNSSKPLEIITAKVVGCTTQDCNETTAKYVSDKLACFRDLCWWSFDSYTFNDGQVPYFFQLITKFPSGEKASSVLDDVPLNYGKTASYQVELSGDGLAIQRIKDISWPGLEFNLESYLISLIIESLVGAIFLAVWKKLRIWEILKYIGTIILVNLVSYPVLWSFFSSVTQFHHKSDKIFGIADLIFGMVFYILLLLAINAINNKWIEESIIFTIATIMSIPLYYLLSFGIFVMGFGSAGGGPMVAAGISVNTAIVLLEIFAVMIEALLLFRMRKKHLTLSQAFLTSLIMNLASFGIGLLIFNPF
jgi:hypothetical protein